MDSTILKIFLFNLPFFILIMLLLLIIYFNKIFSIKENGRIEFKIPALGFLNFSFPVVVKIKFLKIIIIIGAIFVFFYPLFRDYSFLLPKKLEVRSYYDNDGIRDTLNEFVEFGKFYKLKSDWQKDKAIWWEALSRDIYKLNLIDIDSFFIQSKSFHYSVGETSFVVNRAYGLQGYHVVSASGSLRHFLEGPNSPKKSFDSDFELLDTKQNYAKLTFRDLYKMYKFITLKFKQIFRVPTQSGIEHIYRYDLLVMSKVDLFPFIKLEKSIYFKKNEDGTLTPISYCLYVSK